jgi:hypothetical protein
MAVVVGVVVVVVVVVVVELAGLVVEDPLHANVPNTIASAHARFSMFYCLSPEDAGSLHPSRVFLM